MTPHESHRTFEGSAGGPAPRGHTSTQTRNAKYLHRTSRTCNSTTTPSSTPRRRNNTAARDTIRRVGALSMRPGRQPALASHDASDLAPRSPGGAFRRVGPPDGSTRSRDQRPPSEPTKPNPARRIPQGSPAKNQEPDVNARGGNAATAEELIPPRRGGKGPQAATDATGAQLGTPAGGYGRVRGAEHEQDSTPLDAGSQSSPNTNPRPLRMDKPDTGNRGDGGKHRRTVRESPATAGLATSLRPGGNARDPAIERFGPTHRNNTQPRTAEQQRSRQPPAQLLH